MRVDRAYKGVSETALILSDDGMCDGPELRVGEQYLMYTRRDGDGDIPSRGCTRSRHVRYADEDLRYLDGLSAAAPTARVSGRIDIWSKEPGGNPPLPAAVVRLEGPQWTFTAVADHNGVYAFEGLQPGKYTVRVDQPGFMMPSGEHGEFSADVTARGCAAIDVTVGREWPGKIAGRLIRPDGAPAQAGIDLALIRLDDGGSMLSGETHTNDRGEYSLRSIPPDRYKLVVHWCCFPTAEAPYPEIYWPDAATEEDAAEIAIGETAVDRQYDFHLPSELKTTTVSGIVIFPGGKPATGVQVFVLHLPENGLVEVIDAESGSFSFHAVEGVDYALIPTEKGNALTSPAVKFSVGKTDGPTVLIVNPSK
jgi:hypothetical protein